MKEPLAILWDIENVTPSSDSLFVNGLLDYADEIGKVSIARAFGDWTRGSIRGTAEVLADHSFEMIHVPKSKKNSADMVLSTQAVEMIYQYPHLRKLILVTGDADFRPLLQSLRKHHIESVVICDAKSASEDLLLLADDYKDFRELIPDPDSYDVADVATSGPTPSFAESVNLLREAISYMLKNRKTPSLGAVKVRVKLLNEYFDEEKLGFRSWKKFVLRAVDDGKVTATIGDSDLILGLPEEKDAKAAELPDIVFSLIKIVHKLETEGENGKGQWISFATVSNLLHNKKIEFKEHGYGKFKKLVEAAEKRGLVEVKSDGSSRMVRLSKDGDLYFA